jgi:DEAD/DEAH box helicase domain-containing protein
MRPADATLDVDAFLAELREAPEYRDQIVHVRVEPARRARFADPSAPLGTTLPTVLTAKKVERLWSHQAKALDLARAGADFLVTTGPASGKTLCYLLPLIETLAAEPTATALLLFPTKALSRDQLKTVEDALAAAGLDPAQAGVCDGDTPSSLRRGLLERARVLITNPDFLHAAILPHHSRWSRILSCLRHLVVDEMHVYGGIFGAHTAQLFRRLSRVTERYGSHPTLIGLSATIGNPKALAKDLTGRTFALINDDGSPRGKRTFVFWNPPTIRDTRRRSRRSANVEAMEIFTALVRRGIPTITFSKARITAELIHKFAAENLTRDAPGAARRISPYRGGLLPGERREIERRLFSGELLGVSTTRALELGIDVGGMDASVIVGYPGTLAAFFQQAGRAGRRERDALVVLVGLDTPINQYVLRNPDYLFARPVEEVVFDRENPYVLVGHLRCAAQEMPIGVAEAPRFGRHANTALGVLEENRKVRRIEERWFHAASEIPQHEISLRDATDRNVIVEDEKTGAVLGEVSKFDAPAVVHPEAIYLHRGVSYRILTLDLVRSVAVARREEVDYYTQSHGGEDVHHVDHIHRQRPFGTGRAFCGEVTTHYGIHLFEKIRFYTLDPLSWHGLTLPTYPLDTTAFWIEPDENHLREVLRAGLDPASGLRGIGYLLRTLLPLFITCDTRDLSHSIGSVNTPWHTVFVWEHYPKGLGFTERGYRLLDRLVTRALSVVRDCSCRDGCPLCVGKPLRPYTVLNPERGEGSVPSRRAAKMILEGLIGDGTGLDLLDDEALTEDATAEEIRLVRAIRRHLERQREPDVLRPPPPGPPPGFAPPEEEAALGLSDAERRGARRRDFQRKLGRLAAGKPRLTP